MLFVSFPLLFVSLHSTDSVFTALRLRSLQRFKRQQQKEQKIREGRRHDSDSDSQSSSGDDDEDDLALEDMHFGTMFLENEAYYMEK